MAKLQVASAGLNSGAQTLAKKMRVSDIQTAPELSSIFDIEESVLQAVTDSMQEKGFDPAEPIVLWKETGYVVDGHTRLQAAKRAGIAEIPVTEKHFESLSDAQEYTKARQINRRNLSQAELFRIAGTLQLKEKRDGSGRSLAIAAKKYGVSESTLQHARTVWDRGDEETKQAILRNELSVNQGYQTVIRKKPCADETTPEPHTEQCTAEPAEQAVSSSQTPEAAEIALQSEAPDISLKTVVNTFIQKILAELERFCDVPEERAVLQNWLHSQIQQ